MRERCQFENSIYRYTYPLGLARTLRRAWRRHGETKTARVAEGTRSRFAPGEWVRVRDAAAIRATLDEHDRLRGLHYTGEQWAYCGRTFRVQSCVTRMMDDAGQMRAIGRTVTLDGVTCDGESRSGGCGRACPLLFRDDWLEPSSARPAPEYGERYARVKPLAEILATLDEQGRLDGVMFVAAMGRYAGARLPIHKRVQPLAATWWRRAAGEWYILAGARCLGESLGADGPCHRGCGLLWHRAWLELE